MLMTAPKNMNQKKLDFLKKIPLYPLLFAAFTVLILAANNLGQIDLKVIWRPLGTVIGVAIILLLAAWVAFRNLQKAGLLTFCVLLFMLTYGRFFSFMKDRVIGNWVIGTHVTMLALWIFLLILAIFFLVFKLKSQDTLILIMNILTLFMVALQIATIISFQIRQAILEKNSLQTTPDTLLHPDPNQPLPDVYFIVLDKYGRHDALQAYFNYDNSAFIQGLEDLGFWVADCSRSNYAFTVMSLSSQLNMAYVDDLTDNPNLQTTTTLIQNNKVHQAFEEIGYETIAFDMGFKWGNMTESDLYFDSYPNNMSTWGMDPFEIMVLKSTVGILFFEENVDLGRQATLSNLERKAERTYLLLDMLPKIPELSGPKFIHAHFINPHPPYIFNPDGTINPNAEEIKEKVGYPTQLEFLEPRILAVLTEIIEKSPTPPIIILEGDHGFGKKYVTSNLLALYLPDNAETGLYDQITLVNVFPYIFNTYYGTEIPLLPDLSYTHTDDWYESTPLWEWNQACWQGGTPAEPGIPKDKE